MIYDLYINGHWIMEGTRTACVAFIEIHSMQKEAIKLIPKKVK